MTEEKVYTFDLSNISPCRHKFARVGDRVECRCGLGFTDKKGDFPLEEANKVFSSQPEERSILNHTSRNQKNTQDYPEEPYVEVTQAS